MKSCESHLAIIECPFDGKTMHIRIRDCCHLRLLNWAHFALWEHDEHADIPFTPESVYRRAASIPACRSNDRKMFSLFAALRRVLIPSDEEVLEKIPQELQR